MKSLCTLIILGLLKTSFIEARWSTWGSWGHCSVTCGTGTKTATRTCGGHHHDCTGSSSKTTACHPRPHQCPPVDGKLSAWGHWGHCSATCEGSRTRHRYCHPPEHGGAPCSGNTVEKSGCGASHCPVDGKLTDWSNWGHCSATCEGSRTRHRNCHPPEYGGAPCSGNTVETSTCDASHCSVDGKLTDWSNWGHCSATCEGSRTRHRNCHPPKYGGAPCSGNTVETSSCGASHCPVNGGWSEWSSSPCSATCGEGSIQETRSCTNPTPSHGGKDCDGASARVTPCNDGQCPSTTPVPANLCLSDENCTYFNCPRQQHPFCEPNISWSTCGCTVCTKDSHCSNCPANTIGHCTDDTYQRICECKSLPAARCTHDSDCSTYMCTGNASQPFCHLKKFLNFDFSSCDCRECSVDSDCDCLQGMIPFCLITAFRNSCRCKQASTSSSQQTTITTTATQPVLTTTTAAMFKTSCTNDSHCSTYMCTGNASQPFCHEKKFLGFDFSSCDCRECSEDSDCHCQQGLIPHCRITAFENSCLCKQDNSTATQPVSTPTAGLICPECDTSLNCVWERACYPGQVCMLRQYHSDPFTVHCSQKGDCLFMKTNMNDAEIICCEDHQCIADIIF